MFVTAVTAVTSGCFSPGPKVTADRAVPELMADVAEAGNRTFMPRAVAYRTDGDYAGNVPVQYDAARNMLVSFPAPSDLRHDCTPVPLTGGWLLDRMGVGRNTVYTRYTIDDYRALSSVPTADRLIDSIIPGSRVTDIISLPFTLSEALADTAACNRIIRDMIR